MNCVERRKYAAAQRERKSQWIKLEYKLDNTSEAIAIQILEFTEFALEEGEENVQS